MRKENNTPHMGMIVAIGVLIAAIWMLAIYDTIQDAHEEKYDVSVRPGAVSYGTHSSATIPMVSAPTHHTSAPMISGGAVRNYAHYGHAAYTVHHTPYTVHTTSSATVQTVGSGGGGGVSSPPSGGGGASSASHGITYGGASVSMPTFAFVTPAYTAGSMETPKQSGSGPRKVHQDEYGDWYGDSNGEYHEGDGWWNAATEEWSSTPFDGAIKIEGGKTYRYDSSLLPGDPWALVGDQGDPGLPLGDAPWHWMLLLAMGYGIVKVIRKKQNAIQ